MCYELEDLQKIIDNTYEGDTEEASEHIKACSKCREKFNKLRQQDKLIESLLQMDMVIPSPPTINVYTVDFKKENKRRIFNMSKKSRKWSAAVAGIALCGGLLFIEPVRTKAEEFLKIFRMQEITSIAINQDDLREIDEIFRKGSGTKNIEDIIKVDVKSEGKEEFIEAPQGEGEVKEKLSLEKLIKAPEGFVYNHVSKAPKTEVTIKLDIDKTNDILNYLGEKTKLPKSLDQKPFTIHFNEAVSYSFSEKVKNKDKEGKYIYVVEMNTPTVEIPKDVDENQLIKSLFSMSFLPDNLKNQFMKISDLTSTIPIPYDAEHQTKEERIIEGGKAILIKDKNSNYLNVYLQDSEKFYVVNGNCTAEEIISFIEEMK